MNSFGIFIPSTVVWRIISTFLEMSSKTSMSISLQTFGNFLEIYLEQHTRKYFSKVIPKQTPVEALTLPEELLDALGSTCEERNPHCGAELVLRTWLSRRGLEIESHSRQTNFFLQGSKAWIQRWTNIELVNIDKKIRMNTIKELL